MKLASDFSEKIFKEVFSGHILWDQEKSKVCGQKF